MQWRNFVTYQKVHILKIATKFLNCHTTMTSDFHNTAAAATTELSRTLKPLHPSLVSSSSSSASPSGGNNSSPYPSSSPTDASSPSGAANANNSTSPSRFRQAMRGTNSGKTPPVSLSNNSQSQFKKTISSLNQQIQSQIQELQSNNDASNANLLKRSKKNKQKISMMDSEKWMEYVRQLEDKNEMLEHRLEDLNHKFERYKSTAELRQETFIRREKRYKEQDQIMNLKLKDMAKNHVTDGSEMGKLKHLKVKINDRITNMQNDFDTLLQKQKEAHKVEIEDTIRKFTRDLEMERKKNSVEEKDWHEKALAMKQSLQDAVAEAIKLDEQNEKLIKKNKELIVQYKAQKDDRSMILKNVAVVKRENQRLRDRIKQLEQDVEYHATIATQLDDQLQDIQSKHQTYVNDSQSRQTLDQSSIIEREQRYEDTIARLKRLLDQERRNLKSVRKSHLTLLAERTELEIFLRQCIDDVRTEISHKDNVSEEVTFTVDDRRKVIDLLLSKEKVIGLLYDKVFQHKPPLRAARHEEEVFDERYVDEVEEYGM